MLRTILVVLFCLLAANAPLPCRGDIAPLLRAKKLNQELAVAKAKFNKTLLSFPDYQEARRRVLECGKAIPAAVNSGDALQLLSAIQNSMQSGQVLVSITEELQAKDAGIAAIQARIQDNNVSVHLLEEKIRLEQPRRKAEQERRLQQRRKKTMHDFLHWLLGV